MSGLYIPNMTLPENNNWKTIRIYKNGEVAYPNWQGDCTFANTHAISVPDHGRLIDANVLLSLCKEMEQIEWNNKASPYSWGYAYESFEDDIEEAPTVIPADKEGES